MNILLRQPESLMSEYSSVNYEVRTKIRSDLREKVTNKVFHLGAGTVWRATYFNVMRALPSTILGFKEALLDE